MNNKVVNKQIPLETIVKVANHLEDHKEKYDRKFELEENKNKNIPYGEKQWEYENGNTTIKYTIEFKNGKNITESDYNWFVGNLNQPSTIKSISIDLYVSFYTKSPNNTINDVYNKINVSLYFREFDVTIDVDTTNQENEAHNLYSEVMNILEDNEDRYNKTMKHRKISTNVAVDISNYTKLYCRYTAGSNNFNDGLRLRLNKSKYVACTENPTGSLDMATYNSDSFEYDIQNGIFEWDISQMEKLSIKTSQKLCKYD